jgi:8-oxo-dGTP pyrophosphatase MutT (NUDIX family)
MAGSEWTIHGERTVDDTRRATLSIASVELPDGKTFEQYVLRLPPAAIVAVVQDGRVLMVHRHRWLVGRHVWELPGGYLDPDEDPMACAAREVEEETGWRPLSMEPLIGFEPAVGTIAQSNQVYLCTRAEPTGTTPDINEADDVRWIDLDTVEDLIAERTIVGAGSVSGLIAVRLKQARGHL